ncbi:MAG: molybdopterin-dependent oxidoreductase [Candidatus Hydrogenedentes bacterium]|nr:molybdopterin-dependent oxidoreductase [Candidatus Hydrogenedentota bacterium]
MPSHLRICPLCEATCGLQIDTEGRRVTRIEGDAADAFSEGYICPKGAALAELDADPDRLRSPRIRDGNVFREATWDEAFAHIDERLTNIREQHGSDSVGIYLGNPIVHNIALTAYLPALVKALGTRNVFSASTVDQFPKQLASALMFGTGLSVPIPDIDRTHYMLILGANPLVSNGSMMTAPNFPGRLRRLRQRGGKVVVIDPRRTKTAEAADEHHFIRPGTDAYFLFAIVHTLFEDGLINPDRLDQWTTGIDEVRHVAMAFTPERVAPRCGIDADTIRRIAREIAKAPSATVYARIGTCTQEFGTIANWLPDVIHIITGNLDRAGGAMFPKAAIGPGNTKGTPGVGRGAKVGRWKSRVRGANEIFGELPVACLAEEIETPGDGQIRALITVAGNPVLSTPNGARLAKALDSLEFMISLDVYLNETTRHANVILPGPSPLEVSHYDLAFGQLAVRNAARYSPPVFPIPDGQPEEWDTILRLVGVVSGMGANADTKLLDDMVLMTLIQREVGESTSNISGRDTDEILAALSARRGPDRLLDFMLRTGPYGEGFGANPNGLTLDRVAANPHGLDLGPLEPRIPEVLRTKSGKIELAPDVIIADIARLEQRLTDDTNGFVLIGRREVRSNNSWMHNLPMLVSGKPRCTLQMHPDDARDLQLTNGAQANVRSRAGEIRIPIEITDAIMPGTVSAPHGWGHNADGAAMAVASGHAGVNSNLLSDEMCLDVPSGTAVLCGIPVTIER